MAIQRCVLRPLCRRSSRCCSLGSALAPLLHLGEWRRCSATGACRGCCRWRSCSRDHHLGAGRSSPCHWRVRNGGGRLRRWRATAAAGAAGGPRTQLAQLARQPALSRIVLAAPSHLGGGARHGVGQQYFEFDAIIWAADWPGMYMPVARQKYLDKINSDRQKAWKTIGGGVVPEIVPQVPEGWEPPDPLKGIY